MKEKILFATPCYRSDPVEAAQWAADMASALKLEGAIFSTVYNDARIDIAREVLAASLRESACTHILCRDDDIDCYPDLIERMILLNVPIVIAPYRKREPSKVVWVTSGLGLALIHRCVFESVEDATPDRVYLREGRKHVGIFDPIYVNERKLGEDQSFFHRAAERGFYPTVIAPARVVHDGLESTFQHGF